MAPLGGQCGCLYRQMHRRDCRANNGRHSKQHATKVEKGTGRKGLIAGA